MGFNGSSDDSYGIYAFIHWKYMKCRHVCEQTDGHTESGKSGSILLGQNPQYHFVREVRKDVDVVVNVISGTIGCIV